jgi:hypothetical protein
MRRDIPSRNPSEPAVGFILINSGANSLDAHCGRCGSRKNRTFKPHRNPNIGQGRPMGSLIAWLHMCPGSKAGHDAVFNREHLSHEVHSHWHQWGRQFASLRLLFNLERPSFDGEDDEPAWFRQ